MTARPLLFALSESGELGREICRTSGCKFAALEEREFEGGEFKLRPLVPVRDETVYVVQSLGGAAGRSASERLVRLLFLALGLRDAGAARVVAVIPYLAFARKERRTQPRDPVNSRYVAQLIEAARVDRVIALDVHDPAAFDNAFRVGADLLTARPLLVEHFARTLRADEKLAVASPDVGGIKRAQLLRERLAARLGRDIEMVFVEKRRARGIVSGGLVCGDTAGRTVVVIDDLCSTGGTLVRAANALREAGARSIHAAFTHAPLAEGLTVLAGAAAIDSVVLTDSVLAPGSLPAQPRGKFIVLPAAPLLGEALRRLAEHRSLSDLFEKFAPPES